MIDLARKMNQVAELLESEDDGVPASWCRDAAATIGPMLESLRELHVIAADAQLRATYQRTALERISSIAQAAIAKAEGRRS